MDSILIKECKDEHLLEYARDIQSASQTLLSIVNDILDISKIESGKMDILPVQNELFSVINHGFSGAGKRADRSDHFGKRYGNRHKKGRF